MFNGELIPHLFRTEYRKIVSVLCSHFGFDQMETAEDIASETFLTAAQTWGLNGAPPNPELVPANNPVLMPPISGRVGLWSKTDSTVEFKDYVIVKK